jgi:hypothetical protein
MGHVVAEVAMQYAIRPGEAIRHASRRGICANSIYLLEVDLIARRCGASLEQNVKDAGAAGLDRAATRIGPKADEEAREGLRRARSERTALS